MIEDDSPTGVEYGNEPEPTEETPKQTEVQRAGGKSIRDRLDDGEAFVTNFTGDQAATWKFVASVTGGNAKKIADHLNDSIDLRYYYVHKIDMENSRTGEITECYRAAMVTNGGDVYTSVSDGIVNGLEIIRGIFGDGPWNGEVMCRVQQVQTGSKNRTYNLVPA